MQDLFNLINAVPAIAPVAAVKADANGISVNTQGYDSVAFALSMAIAGDTLSGTVFFDFYLEDSPDGTNWNAVAAQYVQTRNSVAGSTHTGSIAVVKTSNASAQVLQAGYIGAAAHVRLSIDVTGTMTNGTALSAVAILGNAASKPAGVTQTP